MRNRIADALLVLLPMLVAAGDGPAGPSRIDFSAQSALTRLTLVGLRPEEFRYPVEHRRIHGLKRTDSAP